MAVAFGRTLRLEACTEGAARVQAGLLFGTDNGAADFYALARHFHTVFVDDMTPLSSKRMEYARRFIAFVDVCYDEGVRIVMLSSCSRRSLFDPLSACDEASAGELRWMITRCMSRLEEMIAEDF